MTKKENLSTLSPIASPSSQNSSCLEPNQLRLSKGVEGAGAAEAPDAESPTRQLPSAQV